MSKSLARLTPGPRSGSDLDDQPLRRRRSSLDNLVIPHRTRLPSSRVSHLEPFDLAVARNLLDAAAQGPDMTASVASNPSEPRISSDTSRTEWDRLGTSSSSSGQYYVRQHSRTASWAADELSTDTYEDQRLTDNSSSDDWTHHELGWSYDGTNDHDLGTLSGTDLTSLGSRVGTINIFRAEPAQAVKRYNPLATVNGLATSEVRQDYVSKKVQIHVEPERSAIGKMVKGAKGVVGRSASSPDLRASHLLPCTNLDELCQRGGCNILKLPADFSPSESLKVPRCLAAMGPLIPGIFREEGSGTDANRLLQYYAKDPSRFHFTAPGKKLPSSLNFTVLEVATAYKKVIRELPGGLLGSLELLKTLEDISLNLNQDRRLSESVETDLRVYLIALALSCVHSENRLSVICATLGLYAWIGHATETSKGGIANMTYQNLSTLLSPLLIGNELNDIKDQIWIAKGSLPSPEQMNLMKANNKSGIAVALMLITNWKGIAKELRKLGANAAALLRFDEKQKRLAEAESVSTPTPSGAPAQQPSDGLNESNAAGNIMKTVQRSLLWPFEFVVRQSKNKVYQGKRRRTTRPGIPYSSRKAGARVRVHDDTGGMTTVSLLPNTNDGQTRRAATSPRPQHTTPKKQVPVGRRRSVLQRGRRGPKKHSRTASGPIEEQFVSGLEGQGHIGAITRRQNEPEDTRQSTVRYRSRQPKLTPTYEGHGHIGAVDRRQYKPEDARESPVRSRSRQPRLTPTYEGYEHIGAVDRRQYEPEDARESTYRSRQPRLAPTYETHDQLDDDFLYEEIPSEDRISNYEVLRSSDYSQSDRGDVEYGEGDLEEGAQAQISAGITSNTSASHESIHMIQREAAPAPNTPTKPAAGAKALTSKSSSDLPYVDNFEVSPTSRARSMIPRPVRGAGRPRRETGRGAPMGSPKYFMSGALGRSDRPSTHHPADHADSASVHTEQSSIMGAQDEERDLRQLMAEYDEWQVGKQAYHLKLTGRMSNPSIRTMSEQEFIETHNWDVEEMGPVGSIKTRHEKRMDDDTEFIVNGRRPSDFSLQLGQTERTMLQPWIDKVLATRKPKSDAQLRQDMEDFKVKIEACKEWHKIMRARMEADLEEKARWQEQRDEEKAMFEKLSDEEKKAYVDRKKREKLERICREADERQARKKKERGGGHLWSRKKKGSSSGPKKSGSSSSGLKKSESSGGGDVDTEQGTRGGDDDGKVSVLKRFFRTKGKVA